jgi:hypothetical protein
MKKITAIMLAGFIVTMVAGSCNDASKKDMGDASKNLENAGGDMKEAAMATNDTAKAAAIAEWKNFKTESDTAIAGMQREATALEAKISKASNKEKDKLKMNLKNTQDKLNELKEKLQKRNDEFENDMSKFDATVASKNQSFEREFKHDMNQLGTAFKDLFKDNVK